MAKVVKVGFSKTDLQCIVNGLKTEVAGFETTLADLTAAHDKLAADGAAQADIDAAKASVDGQTQMILHANILIQTHAIMIQQAEAYETENTTTDPITDEVKVPVLDPAAILSASIAPF